MWREWDSGKIRLEIGEVIRDMSLQEPLRGRRAIGEYFGVAARTVSDWMVKGMPHTHGRDDIGKKGRKIVVGDPDSIRIWLTKQALEAAERRLREGVLQARG